MSLNEAKRRFFIKVIGELTKQKGRKPTNREVVTEVRRLIGNREIADFDLRDQLQRKDDVSLSNTVEYYLWDKAKKGAKSPPRPRPDVAQTNWRSLAERVSSDSDRFSLGPYSRGGVDSKVGSIPRTSSKESDELMGEAGEAIPPAQPSAGTNEQMELRKEHARQIADDLYSLVDSGGKDRLFAKPWTDRYSRLRSQMRLAWEHLQSYPVALAAVEKAVAVRNKHETPNLGRELIDQVRFARFLPSLSQVLAAEKQADFAVRDIVVLLRNGTPLGGTCGLGY